MLATAEKIGIVLSLAFIGADRVDLFVYSGPFTLTPFLFFGTLTGCVALARGSLSGSLTVPASPWLQRQRILFLASGLLLFFALASVMFSLDPPRSAVVFIDLLLVMALGYLICDLTLRRSDWKSIVFQGVVVAVTAHLIFCALEYRSWRQGKFLEEGMTIAEAGMLSPMQFGPIAPRLSGTTVDPNRAGIILVIYLAMLEQLASTTRIAKLLRILLVGFIFVTLSRSAILSLVTYWIISGSLWRWLHQKRTAVVVLLLALIGCCVWITEKEAVKEYIAAAQIANAVETRLTMEQGSSGATHLLLINRGLEIWSSSPLRMVAGIGIGAGYQVLGDIFGGEKHQNFHSMYVTWLAECGLPALVAVLFIMLFPVVTKSGAAAILVPLLVFNIPYQSHLEPMMWFAIAYCWAQKTKTPCREISDELEMQAQLPFAPKSSI